MHTYELLPTAHFSLPAPAGLGTFFRREFSQGNNGPPAMRTLRIGALPEPGRASRLGIVLAGIVAGQILLYGPSLAGLKILLPLDLLRLPTVYLPVTPEGPRAEPWNHRLGDLIYEFEPARRFAASELAAGRLPMWTPWYFAGAPFFWPKLSPFLALQACVASPVVLAWVQLLAALVAGVGAYVFCRRVLGVSFWPAAIAAWCYPLTAFFVLWQGFTLVWPAYWLPWILLAVDRTVRGSSVLAPLGLSVATCLVLISGQLDIAVQVLLTSAVYALWCWLDAWSKAFLQARAWGAALRVASCWGLGLMLAAPATLPLLEYSRTGKRLTRRVTGAEARPPVGLAALPQTVLPDMYGTDQAGSLRLDPQAQAESSAAAYAGVLATLVLAPLAFCSRRHRSVNVLWAGLIFLSLSWCLNVPGLVNLLRLPGLNMLSNNRWVFAASFAILALAAVGLDMIWRGPVTWHPWFWAPAGLLAALCLWCACRTMFLPEPFATEMAHSVEQGKQVGWVMDLAGVRQAQSWFAGYYAQGALLCGLGVAGWMALRRLQRPWLPAALGILLVGDLLWFAAGRIVQADAALYYPRIPVLEDVARAAPGRVIGANCLPANLASVCGLADIRGYDSVDPARLMDLLAIARNPKSLTPEYAFTQYMVPKAKYNAQGEAQLSPVLDMLGVRYVIFRGSPPPGVHPPFQGTDYWVVVNPTALPRAWVPQGVEMQTNAAARLEKLAAPGFDPRKVACVETPVSLSDGCRGTAQIVEEIPTRVLVSTRMETPGLLVLADLWDKGWVARVNSRPTEILRVNHAIRGVVLPAGTWQVEFRYQPRSFAWGLRLAGVAALVLLVWVSIGVVQRRAVRNG